LSILDAIYDAVGDDHAFGRLPAALSTELGSRSCLMHVLTPEGQLAESLFNYWQSEQFKYFVENNLVGLDEWHHFGLEPNMFGRQFNYDDYFSTEHFLRSPIYNEFFRTFGDDTARCLGMATPVEDQVLLVGLHRPARDRPFDRGQLARLQELTGHLRRLVAARAALARGRKTIDQLAAALDAPLIGVIRVDLRGRLVHANVAGQDILSLQDGLVLTGQTIGVQAYVMQQRFAEAIRTAALRTGGQGDALLVPRPSGAPPWRVVVAPDKAQASGHATLLIESSGGEGGLRARLAALYDLTRAESEVAVLLAEGLAPTEIADRRSVSLDTVRNQIKALLQKTGADRLGGLIALMARTLRTQ